MSISVYGWRKPTLELELVEGGSLLANTTYYVCGNMKYAPATYAAVGSCISDIVSITTTTTAKSIRIKHKTYRNITSFASAGAGVTTVNSAVHCLRSGDIIKIDSGSYAGSHIITKINANTFTIPVNYIDNIPVQCYTDSQYYNKPSEFSGTYQNYIGVTYYVYTANPLADGINWTGSSRWTSRAYQNNNLENPTIITAQPAQSNPNNGCLKTQKLNRGFFNACVEQGTILIIVDNQTATFQNIYDAIQAEGFVNHCAYDSSQNYFWLVGSLVLKSNSSYLTSTGTNISIINGEMFYTNATAGRLPLTSCMINTIPKLSQNVFIFDGSDNIIYNNNSSVSFGGWPQGNNHIIQATPYPQNAGNYCDIPSQTLFNFGDNANKSYGVVQNKTLRPTEDSGVIQLAYNQIKFVNTTIFSIYYLMYNAAYGTQPDIYMMENCYIRQSGNSAVLWHFRFYAYAPGIPYQNIIKFLNLNTDDPNNVKKCVNNSVITIDADFYRRVKLYIKTQAGAPIETALVIITDTAGNTYHGQTDVNGMAQLDCLEQRTRFINKNTSAYHDLAFDTHYINFTITISKAGYTTEIVKLTKLYQIGLYDTILNIGLHGTSYPKSRIVNGC